MKTDNKFKGELTINIGGKEIEAAITMNAIRMTLVNEGLSWDQLNSFMAKDPLSALPKIVYYGMVNKALLDGKKAKHMDIEQFIAHFYADDNNLELASETIAESLGVEVTRDNEGNG